jgi:hypothetical protein
LSQLQGRFGCVLNGQCVRSGQAGDH